MSLTPQEHYIDGLSENPGKYIENIDTELSLVSIGNHKFIVTINNEEFDNSYVCSPYTSLISYMLQEVNKVDSKFINKAVKLIVPRLGNYFKNNNINRIVCVNNWILSTNLYPNNIQEAEFREITNTMLEKYPTHAIVFRSLNNLLNHASLNYLERLGYLLVPSRQVYIYSKRLNKYYDTKDYKNDMKLLKNTRYQYVPQEEFADKDIVRAVELYRKLYIKKYSIHNPNFTEAYIRKIIENDMFYLYGYRNEDNELDSVGGRFILDNIITLPIVGFDTEKPKSEGLYRLVVATNLKYAYDNNYIIHASSGAPHFKTCRGAVSDIEYSAIYIKHLPKSTRRMWRFVEFALSKVAVPIVKKYKL